MKKKWFQGPRSFPPTPQEFTESLWCETNSLKDAISMLVNQENCAGRNNSSNYRNGRLTNGQAYIFVGQPVGVDQVNDVCIGDSGATTHHMTRNTDLMYDTRPPSTHRSRILLGERLISSPML